MAMVALHMLLRSGLPVFAQEAISQEEPTPSSVEEIVTPMQRSFEEKIRWPRLFPWLKEKLKDTNPFFRDTRLDLHLRTYYRLEDDTGSAKKEAWALGSDLIYQSGYFLEKEIEKSIEFSPAEIKPFRRFFGRFPFLPRLGYS